MRRLPRHWLFGQPRRRRPCEDQRAPSRQIRTSIFQLRGALGPQTSTVRSRLLDVVAELTAVLGFAPGVSFDGPIDVLVPPTLVDDLVAVLREALTNVARHAHATQCDVQVSADPRQLSIEVVDDGVGIGTAERRSGLASLRSRAEQRGGDLTFDLAASSGGTRLQWRIPL